MEFRFQGIARSTLLSCAKSSLKQSRMSMPRCFADHGYLTATPRSFNSRANSMLNLALSILGRSGRRFNWVKKSLDLTNPSEVGVQDFSRGG